MSELPTTLSETVKRLAVDYIKTVKEQIRKDMGGRPSDAVEVSGDDELQAWMRVTASPEQIAQMIAEGADDETILKTARKYRFALGKQAGQGDPIKETEYHEKMQRKAQAWLAERMPKPQPAPVPDISAMMPQQPPQPMMSMPQQPADPMLALGG